MPALENPFVDGNSIIAYQSVGIKDIYDFTVPEYGNYITAGVVHHNTLGAGMETAYHLTGIYPEWWKGKRFDKPIRCWIAGVTGESTRDNPQRILVGPVGNVGSGTIPKDLLLRTSAARGIPDAVETVLVRHITGGVSQATFKAYSDGREKWQGETLELIWNDEEPPIDIYIEGLTRTNTTGGIVLCTFTPLLGMSDVVIRFLKTPSEDRAAVKMTIDDVGHYTADEKRKIIEGYPLHEREARARGEPMLGSGRIFPFPESWIEEDAIVVPETWYRLAALDFGWDHPTAAVMLAGDSPDISKVTLHLVKAYRQARETPLIHCAHLKTWGDVPFAWPHDALQHDKGSGEQLKDIYKRNGLRMISEKAQFPDHRGNGLEAGITEMLELIQTGRLKADRNLHDWFEEYRTYHRKDGKVVKEREDLISACLHPQTEIMTSSGAVAIVDLVGTSGHVLSAGGEFVPYLWCRKTRTDAPLAKVVFDDGLELLCTPDHKLLSADNRWVDARHAQWMMCHNALSKAKSTSRVLRVESAGRSDVYCMEVPRFHALALKNGVVVHNSRYAVMMWRYAQPLVRPDGKRDRYSKPRLKHAGATWMSL